MKTYNQNSIDEYLLSLNKTQLPWEKSNDKRTEVVECVCGACGGPRKTKYPINLIKQANKPSV